MAEADIDIGATGPDLAGLRRAPSQKRSRERVERMLTAASEVITEQGSDAMRMGEVAERAGVSIGSLYQYFPDKGSIIRPLRTATTLWGATASRVNWRMFPTWKVFARRSAG